MDASHCLHYLKTMFYIKAKCVPSLSVERLVQKWLENHWTKKTLSFKFHGRTKDAFLEESECSLCSEIWELKLLQNWNIKLMKAWLGIEILFMWFRLNLHKLISALESSKSIILWLRKFVFSMSVFLFCMAIWENHSDWSNAIGKATIQSLTLLPNIYLTTSCDDGKESNESDKLQRIEKIWVVQITKQSSSQESMIKDSYV
jgi:hypothetical protein